MQLKRQLGLFTAVMIIIADVIGAGIFFNTSGVVLKNTNNGLLVLLLWAIGGLVAISGALCYAELAGMWPEDGGEYVYLRRIFGPFPSFLTGWTSLVVGFTAAAAFSALLAVNYLAAFLPLPFLKHPLGQRLTAVAIVLGFGISHLVGVQKGSRIQNALTILKLLIVFAIIGGGVIVFSSNNWEHAGRLTTQHSFGPQPSLLTLGAMLIGYIMYAYSGWNGTTYIAGEIRNPERNLGRAMLRGTLLVTLIYLALNVVFLIANPAQELLGKYAVIGAITTGNLFGPAAGRWFSLAFTLILLSSVSVQMMLGPRVYYAMARDRAIFHNLSRVHPRFGTPVTAIYVQIGLTVVYVLIGFGNLSALMTYLGFSLTVFPLLAVIGLIRQRRRQPQQARPFPVPLYPLVPLFFIVLTSAMIITALIVRPIPSLSALGALTIGSLVYLIWQRRVARAEKLQPPTPET